MFLFKWQFSLWWKYRWLKHSHLWVNMSYSFENSAESFHCPLILLSGREIGQSCTKSLIGIKEMLKKIWINSSFLAMYECVTIFFIGNKNHISENNFHCNKYELKQYLMNHQKGDLKSGNISVFWKPFGFQKLQAKGRQIVLKYT